MLPHVVAVVLAGVRGLRQVDAVNKGHGWADLHALRALRAAGTPRVVVGAGQLGVAV
eukprot:SAG11_NODE_34300_length_272_cov_2.017341_1_plen_56_part_01